MSGSPVKGVEQPVYVLPSKWHRVEADVARHEHLLQGAGDPAKGVVVRLDRVERRVAVTNRLAWAILVAVLAAWASEVVPRWLNPLSAPQSQPHQGGR